MWLSSTFVALAVFARSASAQQSGWLSSQVNTTMCQWIEPRAAIIRDTIYLDGGDLYWLPGMADGSYGAVIEDGNPMGLVYTLNFSTPFNLSQPAQNLSQVFGSISKAPNGGAANNFGPQYYDGAMFANDGEFFTYGGLLANTEAFSLPGEDAVLSYQAYWYGAPGKAFSPGFVAGTLPAGLTRYVTDGAEVSVPSENLGFYFGGLKSVSGGPIFTPSINESITADTLSNNLITLDMSIQQSEVWSSTPLPTSVPGRANAELVWLPVGKRGVLVALGGVVYPEYAFANQSDSAAQSAESQKVSPTFMSTVPIYDIEAGYWYMQPTGTGGPPALTQGCAVVASSQDYSSHNIYWYGGFDGINEVAPFSDDVWILSIPSFMWMPVYRGTSGHGRAGHKCVKPYPDQMMVIGGYTSQTGDSLTCVQDGIIQLFNLSSTSWLDSYDPNVWSEYQVPEMISTMIGGNGLGGAHVPPSSWSNQSLAGVFSTAYNTSKIKNWYPYKSNAAANNTRPDVTSTSSGSSLPSWVAPVLGVVLGLIAITAIIAAIFLYRRRRFLKTQNDGMGSSDVNRNRIMSWVHGADHKAPTVTSDETSSPYDDGDMREPAGNGFSVVGLQEAPSNMVHEMPDTSQIQELSATGLAYISPSPQTQYSYSSPSTTSTPPLKNSFLSAIHSHPSNASSTSKLSTRTSSSTASAPPDGRVRNVSPLTAPPIAVEENAPRPDSPSLGDIVATSSVGNTRPQTSRIHSDVSVVSVTDQRRLVGEGMKSPVSPLATPPLGSPSMSEQESTNSAAGGENPAQTPKKGKRSSYFVEGSV